MSNYWWVPDDAEVWAYAVQIGENEANGLNKYKIVKTQKVLSLPANRCLPAPQTLDSEVGDQYPEDLVSLADVNQGAILYNTKQRFAQKKIYTACGSVIMSVNPFQHIPIYGEKMIAKYINPNDITLPTHLYLIPSRAYNMLCSFNKNQSILISGESGAGALWMLYVL